MTTANANLFLCSFVVTYNFSRMIDTMGKTGLTLGLYGGIDIVG
jgi:hypothetical protein